MPQGTATIHLPNGATSLDGNGFIGGFDNRGGPTYVVSPVLTAAQRAAFELGRKLQFDHLNFAAPDGTINYQGDGILVTLIDNAGNELWATAEADVEKYASGQFQSLSVKLIGNSFSATPGGPPVSNVDLQNMLNNLSRLQWQYELIGAGSSRDTFNYSGGNNNPDLGVDATERFALDNIRISSDTDADGIRDSLDLDADNDGITDNIEAQSTSGYVAPSGVDANNDGLDDIYDTRSVGGTVDLTGMAAATSADAVIAPVDTDGDGDADYIDTDADNDGTSDNDENGLNQTAITKGTLSTAANDADGDGLFDQFETQNGTTVDDGFNVNEGLSNGALAYPDSDGDAALQAPLQHDVDFRDAVSDPDTDGDGVVDLIDVDDDNDGIVDDDERDILVVGPTTGNAGEFVNDYTDNRVVFSGDGVGTYGAEWLFSENVAVGTVRTFTFDNAVDEVDLLFRSINLQTVLGNFTVAYDDGTTATNVDIEVIDDLSIAGGGNGAVLLERAVAGSTIAIDNPEPTVANNQGYGRVQLLGLDPEKGIQSISFTTLVGSFANNALVRLEVRGDRDADRDGIADQLDLDSDNDGITDNVEAQATDAYIAPTGLDDDNDGLDNAYDATPNGTANGAGSLGLTPVDTDGDGDADYIDTDADNDGTSDNDENGLNQTAITKGTLSTAANDADGDGLFDQFETQNGTTVDDGFNVNEGLSNGALAYPDSDGDAALQAPLQHDVDFRDAVSDPDTDGDGVVDLIDVDDDNDGILDAIEKPDAPTVLNGNFDDGVVGVYNATNNNNLPGWYVEAGNIDWMPGGQIDLSGYLLGTISQVVTTVPGTTYTLTFEHMANATNGSQIAEFASEVFDASNNVLIGSTQFNSVFGGLVSDSITFTAASTSTEIQFRQTSFARANGGSFLDNVSLVVTGPSDVDGDGIVNSLDLDADNDGITDNIEAQSTAGYVAPSGVDANNDGLDDIYDNRSVGGTVDLTGMAAATSADAVIAPVDTDGDGDADYIDTDSDNDGTSDNDENGLNQTAIAKGTLSTAANDADGDGLFDQFEAVLDGNVDDGFVVNERVTNPLNTGSAYLPDAGGDSAFGTPTPLVNDLDYRDRNDDPVAQDDAANTNEDTVLNASVLPDNGNGADRDPDGDALNVSAIVDGSGPSKQLPPVHR